jgi:hypothetical protein
MHKTLINSSLLKTVVLWATLLVQRYPVCIAGEKVTTDSSPTKPLTQFNTGAEKLSDAFAKIAKAVKPSLVRIQPCYGDNESYGDKEINSSLAIPFELDGGTSNSIQTTGSVSVPDKNKNPNSTHGSGVVVSEDGYLWTSSDVVRDAKSARVILSTGEEFNGKILFVDQESGLAILKIEAAGLSPLKLADNAPCVAEWAMAVSPELDDHPILSRGIVWLDEYKNSSRGTRVGFFSYNFPGVRIEPGSALVNLQGQLVGIDVPPPLLFKNSPGTRYGLSSNSAHALQHEISDEAISLADKSTGDISVASTKSASDVTKHRQDQATNRRTNHVNLTEFSKRENSRSVISTNGLGDPMQEWLDWLKEKLSPALQGGGMISQ